MTQTNTCSSSSNGNATGNPGCSQSDHVAEAFPSRTRAVSLIENLFVSIAISLWIPFTLYLFVFSFVVTFVHSLFRKFPMLYTAILLYLKKGSIVSLNTLRFSVRSGIIIGQRGYQIWNGHGKPWLSNMAQSFSNLLSRTYSTSYEASPSPSHESSPSSSHSSFASTAAHSSTPLPQNGLDDFTTEFTTESTDFNAESTLFNAESTLFSAEPIVFNTESIAFSRSRNSTNESATTMLFQSSSEFVTPRSERQSSPIESSMKQNDNMWIDEAELMTSLDALRPHSLHPSPQHSPTQDHQLINENNSLAIENLINFRPFCGETCIDPLD